jgi:hypothetical protein
MRAIHKKRLLNVARALEESPVPKAFDMQAFCHNGEERYDGNLDRFLPAIDCGTPACALGHYASRRDLQRVFDLGKSGGRFGTVWGLRVTGKRGLAGFNDRAVLDHFALSKEESAELFDQDGCGDAKTTKQAARYIRKFVARKEREARK